MLSIGLIPVQIKELIINFGVLCEESAREDKQKENERL